MGDLSNKSLNFYLQKYGFIEPQISTDPHKDLGIIVVIPCFNEPDLIRSLQSLFQCNLPKCSVEVITVINSGEHHESAIKEQNLYTMNEARFWAKDHTNEKIKFHFIHQPNLPKKHAGVGLARKIGMDEAVFRFHSLDRDGIIVCFDADAEVEQNYLSSIEQHFINNPNSPGCSIHFEHPIEGDQFEPEIYNGIIQYELHLRYYKEALNYCKLPYSYHTVGSSMAVRSSAYQKQGGMNKRKAGEDFYFIHKIIALGDFTELNNTKVIPSPRISDRVPFGTGKAIGDWMEDNQQSYKSYNINSFEIIKNFVSLINDMYEDEFNFDDLIKEKGMNEVLLNYLIENDFQNILIQIKNNTNGFLAFQKRFFVWLDAFRVLKILHYLRDHGFPGRSILTESSQLLNKLDFSVSSDQKELLQKYRDVQIYS